MLVEQNLNSLNDLSESMLPSVHIGSNSRSANLYIRGTGSGESQNFDQSVGIFEDDIYHGRARMSDVMLFDLDRIEILKGPQTTFFGNNAIAGAFNIVTKQPTNEFESSARALYGQDGQYTVEAAAGGPIAQTISARLAVMADGLIGWLNNESIGRNVPGENNIGGRLTLLSAPSDNFDATLKLEGSKTEISVPWLFRTAIARHHRHLPLRDSAKPRLHWAYRLAWRITPLLRIPASKSFWILRNIF